MGDFVGTVGSPGSKIPIELSGKIVMRATYPLTEHEAFLFTAALNGIVIQMKKECFEISDLRQVFVLCTEDGKFTFADKEGMGYYLPLIILNLGNWRTGNWSDVHIIATLVEEFCHHFWSIDDEEIVKHKVLEILNRILNFEVTFDSLYGPRWKEAYPTIYGDDIK
ncbi:hypothetical protein [Salinicoccus sp. HZC-1]|uniref:hypothetical protein n=1 Tax=Salinicoccus sp. HZC-1 TaxID=3385497 RepID=UPI00398B1ABB